MTNDYHDDMETTITLVWDPPQGNGPEAIVDNYTISISPAPPNQPANILVSSSPWNVTLAHNNVYNINLTAINCIGESKPVTLPDIEYSKRDISLYYTFNGSWKSCDYDNGYI